MTCDFCFSKKHYRCRGCDCTLCAQTRSARRKDSDGEPAKARTPRGPKAPETISEKERRLAERRARYPRIAPEDRKVCGPDPWAMAPDERHLVYVLHSEGNNITKITEQMGKPRSQIKAEVARIRRGRGITEFPLAPVS